MATHKNWREFTFSIRRYSAYFSRQTCLDLETGGGAEGKKGHEYLPHDEKVKQLLVATYVFQISKNAVLFQRETYEISLSKADPRSQLCDKMNL